MEHPGLTDRLVKMPSLSSKRSTVNLMMGPPLKVKCESKLLP